MDERRRRGVPIGGAITLHNAPEESAMGIAFASALDELVAVAEEVIPIPAGAILAVVRREMVPMSHGHGYADAAIRVFLVRFVLLVLDAVCRV